MASISVAPVVPVAALLVKAKELLPHEVVAPLRLWTAAV